MTHTTKKSLIGITIAAAMGATAIIGFSHDGAKTAPEVFGTALTAPKDSSSTTLASPVSAAPTAVQPVKAQTKSVPSRTKVGNRAQPKHNETQIVETTTTSEVPPRLTAEQEAKIPGPGEEGEAKYNDPDHHEFVGQDYDLPSESSTSPAP